MIADSSRGFAEASIRKAEKALKSARILLEHGELEDATSRAYYAMFHAARAVLFNKGLKAKTHKGTITLFGEYVVKRGLMSERYADMLRRAFDIRQRSDYEVYFEVDRQTAEEAILDAEEFIKVVKKLLNLRS